MVKAKGKVNGNSRIKRGRKRGQRNSCSNTVLDYARLLASPAEGPLVHPLYGGASEGYLIRVRRVITAAEYGGNNPVLTRNLSCVWTPGDPRRGVAVYRNTDSSDTQTAGYLFTNPLTDTGFPVNAARVVAASLEAKYVGKEIDRGGLGSCGQMVVNALPNAAESPVTQANAWTSSIAPPSAVVAEHVTDHPNHMKVVLRPTEVDQQWRSMRSDDLSPLTPIQAPDGLQNPSLFTTINGTPGSTPYVFILTAVYEWKPAQRSGLVNVPTITRSVKETAADAIRYLADHGMRFATSVASEAIASLPAITMAYGAHRSYGRRIEL